MKLLVGRGDQDAERGARSRSLGDPGCSCRHEWSLSGWAVSAAIQRRWRHEQGEQGPAVDQPRRMGEPGLAPPSTSAEALAEVAQLEELWLLPAKRAITGTD